MTTAFKSNWQQEIEYREAQAELKIFRAEKVLRGREIRSSSAFWRFANTVQGRVQGIPDRFGLKPDLSAMSSMSTRWMEMLLSTVHKGSDTVEASW